MTTLRALVAALIVIATFGVALAKLPPPAPLTDAQKAAGEEKKAKDAAAAEAEKAAMARAQDRVAARYFADMKAKGKAVPPPQVGPTAMAAAANVKGSPAKTPATPAAKK